MSEEEEWSGPYSESSLVDDDSLVQEEEWIDEEEENSKDGDFENALTRHGVSLKRGKKHRENKSVYQIANVELGKKLGEGAFGHVYAATLKNGADHRHQGKGKQKTGSREKQIAVKSISKDQVAKKGLQKQLALEIAVHRLMVHPNIIQFLDFDHNKTHVYFYLEFAPNGDLLKYVKHYKLNERELARLMRQVGEAVLFCHSYQVIHRDLKPENILMTIEGVPKLTDFGYCDKADSRGMCKHELFCGTTDFMAPEIINEQPCGYPVDVWAFGVIIYDLLVGHPPFEGETRNDTYWKIRNCNLDWRCKAIQNVKPLLRDIFIVDQQERITMAEVLEDEWF